MPRSSHINYLCDDSDGVFIIQTRSGNFQITGAEYGFIILQHSISGATMRALFVTSKAQSLAAPSAASAEIATSSLPATITLNEVNGSGISGTGYVDGVQT